MNISLNQIIGNQKKDSVQQWTLDALSIANQQRLVESLRVAHPEKRLAFFDFATQNNIAPIAAHALIESGVDGDEDAGIWESAFKESESRMTVMMSELDRIAAHLDRAGIPVVALKNGGIARGLFHSPACCPMGDLDLLVSKEDYLKGHELLLETGYKLASRSVVEPAELEHGVTSGGTEYLIEVEGQTVWVELQWRSVAGRWIRPEQEPESTELMSRSVPIEGSCVRLLSPLDNMIQVCLHTAKHSFVRAPGVRLHSDVDRLAHLAPPDWSLVVEEAQKSEITTAVYCSLALAKCLLHTPIPDWVLTAIAPPRWKINFITRWINRVSLFEKEDKQYSRIGMMALHSLLYDNMGSFSSSLFDVDRKELGLRYLPRNLARGSSRIYDLLTRYQK
jgi:hypothetical protein